MDNLNFECPICLENIKYATVGSCMHHFCYFCLFNHCKTCYKNNIYAKCPLCKEPINELKLDREFDKLITGPILPHFNLKNEIIIDCSCTINDPGLTIKNNTKGPGIIIIKLNKYGLFQEYNFKIGDIILFINDIPCNNHTIVMKQIMNLFNSRKLIKNILL